MDKGTFISQILAIYEAWVETVADYRYVNGMKVFCTYRVYRYDTKLGGKPVIDIDDNLWDYSGFLTLKITPENCFNWRNEADIKSYPINTMSFERAAKIMENNIKAAIALEKIELKAKEVQEIVRNS